MKQKIFLILGILLFSIAGFSIYSEFMVNHTYYYDMFSTRANRKLIIRAIIAAGIPTLYILKTKQFSFKNLFLKRLPIGLVLFSIAHTLTKESIFGSPGFLMLCLNTVILYALGIFFLWGITSLGTLISEKRIKLPHKRRQELAINFGIGLGAFLILIKLLVAADVMYSGIARLLLLGLGGAIYGARNLITHYTKEIQETCASLTHHNTKTNPRIRISIIIIFLGIIYWIYGFQLAFIPYSTAWDANHEYMYIPKVLAENHGVLWGDAGKAGAAPLMWHAFITFWFSIGNGIKGFWLGSDTIAVAMNFLSGILVLILGIGLIKEILAFFSPKAENEDHKQAQHIASGLGQFLTVLWLTSGMGAFLVFVDNKTDLGVMAITTLALLSGMIFLNYKNHHQGETTNKLGDIVKYISISGVFFALASMSKQTAFIDIALFGLLLINVRTNNIITMGLGISLVGATGILQVGNAADLISPLRGKWLIAIGLLVIIGGIFQLWKAKYQWKQLKDAGKYIGIRAISLIGMLLIFKGPFLIHDLIQSKNLSAGQFVKGIILATTETSTGIQQQTITDNQILISSTNPATCAQMKFSDEDLTKGITKAIAGNEDVGRYVGYGRKTFEKKGFSLGYALLRILTPKDNTCYGVNHDAKLLCKNSTAIDTFDQRILTPLLKEMNPESKAYDLLSGALTTAQKNIGDSTNATIFRDQIVSLRNYYQAHSIKTEQGKVSIPYRYITPLNITFNRSLQNLSSYYTDIGFIRVFAIFLLCIGFIYALCFQEKKLITITSLSIIGWAVRWMIGGGILWYGMGLIIWTILATAMTTYHMFINTKKEEKNLVTIVIILFVLWGVMQLFFNLIRISSQGAGGPFARYKMSIGKTVEFSDSLQQQEILKNGYKRKDVFDLQFPHYNKFMNYVENRKDEDGVLIAGTYIQYFLKQQRNIKNDGMLTRFREQNSDGDFCKASKRLEKEHVKYLVIDPNIGTVGMGEGNETLFHRFFAKLDPVTNNIQTDGAITMLVKNVKAGYLKLFETNNIGAKYAFTLDDQTLINAFGGNAPTQDITLLRGKMAIARYFPDANVYINAIANLFIQRIGNGGAIGDIADIYGKPIDEKKLTEIARKLSGGISDQKALEEVIKPLSQDERTILAQYLGILNISKNNQSQLQEILNSLLGQSLGGSSQLMVFERM